MNNSYQTLNSLLDAHESEFLNADKSKYRKNIIQKGNLKAIKKDVYIKDLDDTPTLITNIIQYTPYNLIMNLIDGTMLKKEICCSMNGKRYKTMRYRACAKGLYDADYLIFIKIFTKVP
jgi:hypothetical protein